jgi:hypothetical protein
MNISIEKLEEIEETIAWNLSFNITPLETLNDCYDLDDDQKKIVLEYCGFNQN